MITLDQIQLLDKKIKDAIELINTLRDENKTLRGALSAHEQTIARLEEELSASKSDSDRIEEGFNEALSRLDLVDGDEAVPGQQEQSENVIQPQTEEVDEAVEEETEEADEAEAAPAADVFAQVETVEAEIVEENVPEEDSEDESNLEEEIVEDDKSLQEEMQFETDAEEASDDPASEEPDIDEGFPLAPDDTIIEETSQVNHSEQQEDEDTRSPQDLDIF